MEVGQAVAPQVVVVGSLTTPIYLIHRLLRHCRSRAATQHRWMSRLTTRARMRTKRV